jgi:ribonucleotide reductase alpha subunit
MAGPVTPIAQEIRQMKHMLPGESYEESIYRLAHDLSEDKEHERALEDIFGNQRFLPGGRIQAAAGTGRSVTYYNCYVSDRFDDSFEGIMRILREAGLTMRMGGGIGYDFSPLRPNGSQIISLGSKASGPVSFMEPFDALCGTISSAGHRRGAQMATLRVDHPDIVKFIDAKMNSSSLTNFNISVLVTDEFMNALYNDGHFQLKFPKRNEPYRMDAYGRVITGDWDVYDVVRARDLWEKIMRNTWEWAEPGVIFIDRINAMNNLWYDEYIAATNPCFTGDTKVWTAEGEKTFKELAEAGTDVPVLTEDSAGQLIYRMMRQPRVTRRDAKLVEVTLRSHKGDLTTVKCTPNHEFYLKSGEGVRADSLKSGDRLKSAYRYKANSKGYQKLSNGREEVLADNHVVVDVKELDYTEDVYCGTVDETSRFFLAMEGHGVLVSNCGEQPLPPHGACLLGSTNVVKYVTSDGHFDHVKMEDDLVHVYRAMDNVIDKSLYPLEAQMHEAKSKRRMGLGVTGMANALEKLGHPYASDCYLHAQGEILRYNRDVLYSASADQARSKGSFDRLDRELFMQGRFIQGLPEHIRNKIERHGIRNSHLTSIAPTGTISLAADNVSGGIEPPFSLEYNRVIQEWDGPRTEKVQDYAWRVWGVDGKTSGEIAAKDHVAVLTNAQQYVDSAVSKTCNVSPDMPWEEFKNLYIQAYEGGAKGCTTFNPGGGRQGILNDENEGAACTLDPDTGARSCSE